MRTLDKKRQEHLRKLDAKNKSMTRVLMASAREIGIEAQEAEDAGLKTCIVLLEVEKGEEGAAILLLGEDGKAVQDLGALLKRGRIGDSRFKEVLRWILNAVVVVADKPWAQRAAENVLTGWMSSRGRRTCPTPGH